MKLPMILGMARMSRPMDWPSPPTTMAPFFMAYQLKRVEITVKQTDDTMLV
jgi:hypothetical protein